MCPGSSIIDGMGGMTQNTLGRLECWRWETFEYIRHVSPHTPLKLSLGHVRGLFCHVMKLEFKF